MEGDSLICRLYRTRLIGELTYSHLFFLKKELKGYRSVLDVGPGSDSPLRYFKVPYSVGVDIHEPSILESRKKKIHNSYVIADARNLEFKPDSFDAVVLAEVLEHLDKEEGLRLLSKIERWARRKIVVSTPNGYLYQPALYGNPHQLHRSGWDIEEIIRLGYKAYGMVGLRCKPSRFLFFPLAAWAVVSVLLQSVTYYFPKIAFEVCYVKDKMEK